MSIPQLYIDKNLDDIILKLISQGNNEFDIVKSELFMVLLEGKKIESIPTYMEQVYYCINIVMTMRKNTSPYYKTFKNSGMPKSKTILNDDSIDKETIDAKTYNEDKYIITDKINNILNTELPWYESHLFRLYYIPFPDPHCEKQTYSLRDMEKMHTYGDYSLKHVAIHLKIKKTFNYIIKRLKEEKYLTEIEVEKIYNKKHKLNGTRGPSTNY